VGNELIGGSPEKSELLTIEVRFNKLSLIAGILMKRIVGQKSSTFA
jgi:hypothetical protein